MVSKMATHVPAPWYKGSKTDFVLKELCSSILICQWLPEGMTKTLVLVSPDSELSQGTKVTTQRTYLENCERQLKDSLLHGASD